jgi:predicted cupin superfamily sugar epimerase
MAISPNDPSRHPPSDDGAHRVIDHLGLEAHPEGGWFRRTWTSTTTVGDGTRAAGSSVLYLLQHDERSHWHRIDATESWQHAAGAPMRLSTWEQGDRAVSSWTIGPDLLDGQVPQHVVEPTSWQSARSLGAWSLVVCVVVPEFDFDGFELAAPDWAPPV